ncbi:hypothetical protein EXIGLDRAFT_736697 [Exidia glandulosa HHB12029]|uniref:Spindle assembly checkpoint component MAD1 n=1 Tax=Exidia glandulosa HHB12029 TaxID=1314781 RepID=A0A165PBT8_EXIGL|nr:hypothetical protein EXIGLDRAFT_736697 [Exidia glandulosa HHB12029]
MSKRTAARAQLDQDPARSAARRQEKVQAFARDMSTAALEKRLMSAEDANRKLEETLREKDAVIDRLESDRRWLADREKEERETKDTERAQWRKDKASLEEQVREHRSAAEVAQQELEEERDVHIALSRKYSNLVAKYESQMSLAARKTELLDEQLRAATATAEEKSAAVNRLQSQVDDLLAKHTEEARRAQEENNWTLIREELHRQATHVKKIEVERDRALSELRVLRSRADAADVLREEKHSLEKKLRTAEQYRDQVARLQAEVDAAHKERADWAKQRSATPTKVVSELTELRLQYASLLEAQGALKVEIRQKEAEIDDLQATAKETTHLVASLQAKIDELNDNATKRERRVALAEREVSFLNAMLVTFDAEEAGKETTPDEAAETQKKRIEHLESVLQGYKTELQDLEQQIRVLRQALATKPTAAPSSADVKPVVSPSDDETRQALSDAQQVVRRQETKIDELEQTLFELRGTIAQGNHVPPKVRVLGMRGSPLQEWEELQQANLDRLKAENTALLKRLAELQARSSNSDGSRGDLLPRESFERLEKENEQLQEERAQKIKRFDRLKEVYTAKSHEFKDAVSMLLGFKLTFFPNGQCKATSIYDTSAKFTFGPSPDDKKALVLLDSGKVPGLDMENIVYNYLITRGSIPCFLAAITLECQDQYSNAQRTGYT